MTNSDEAAAYAAAGLREHLRDVDLGESSEAYPHAGLVQNQRSRLILNQLALAHDGNIQDTQAWEDLVRPEGTETITEAVREGRVSSMQFAVGMVDHSEDGGQAKPRLAQQLSNEGAIGLILGPPGAGKTALALDTARVWKSLTNGLVASNVIDWPGTDIAVETSEELLDAMGQTEGQVLGLIDEASQNLTSRGSEQSKTNKFAKDLKMVRKKQAGDRFAKRGSVVLVGHTQKDTAAELRRLATMAAEKPSRQDPGRLLLYESEGGRDELTQIAEFEGVTDSPEEYNQHEASQFDVVMDADEDDGDGEESGPSEREVAIKHALQAVKPWTDEAGVSQRDAASIVGYSEGWISDRVHEWRDGKHRDLVKAPAN